MLPSNFAINCRNALGHGSPLKNGHLPLSNQTWLANLPLLIFFRDFATKICLVLVSYFFRVWCCCLLLFSKISGSSLIDPSLIEKNVCKCLSDLCFLHCITKRKVLIHKPFAMKKEMYDMKVSFE